MVGDDDIQSHLHRPFYLGHVGNAAVDGNDQAHALLVQLLEYVGSQSVPFRLAVGYVGDSLTPEQRESLDEGCGGGNAVGIEVSVNADGLPGKEGLVDSGYRFLHAGKQEGVM